MQLLTEEFLSQYPDAPEHMTELGAFVFYRTYSRWIEDEGRRETWKEAVARAVDYNMSIQLDEIKRKGFEVPIDLIRVEAETLFDNVFNLRQFLSGRTHWVGGADVAHKFPLANFNCSFLEISKWEDLGDLFYLLLVGTGVGFKSTRELAESMKPIRDNFEVVHQEYIQRYPVVKVSKTQAFELRDKWTLVIHVGDSKEGWVDALNLFFKALTEEDYEWVGRISIHYDYIRPKGSRLKTFGGTASGYEPLRDMFIGIEKVIKGELDPDLDPPERVDDKYVKMRPIHFLDIGNLIGNNVVVGGVRRTAEIFLCDPDDWEVIFAKYGINGIWDSFDEDGQIIQSAEDKHKEVVGLATQIIGYTPKYLDNIEVRNPNTRPLHHRRLSNNSIAFHKKPSREMLNLILTITRNEGEPGIINLESALKRRPNAKGVNPCAEILLDSYGVCNLTTINVDAFAIKQEDGSYKLDFSGLMEAQALSTRAGVRMTLLDLEIPHWDDVHKRDRLIGTSLTGWQDAMDKLGYNEEQENQLLNLLNECSRFEAMRYADTLRIPVPLLTTTIKPEGTLSQVAGGVSSGLHRSHAEYYIRRIRISAKDPLAQVAKHLGWRVHADVGTQGLNTVEELSRPDIIEQADTLVIDFPVHSGAKTTKEDVFVEEQFETYFNFQQHYTEHNSSITIHVRPNEWDKVEDIMWERWDELVGVSFIPYDGGGYVLAPYEAITKEEYEALRDSMTPFTPEALQPFENKFLDKELAMKEAEGCEGGACPIF